MPALSRRAPARPASRPPLRRIGHKGADHIAPGNTTASFDAALEAGVDMIEFDVLPEHRDGSGELWLAHDHAHVRRLGEPPQTFEQGLAHLAGETFSQIELLVDLKLPGYELRVLDALRRRGLVERAIVSTLFLQSLGHLREAEPALRLSWSVPRVRRDYTAHRRTAIPALAALTVYRTIFPLQARAVLRSGRADLITAHWRLVTHALLRTVHRAGGELYVWTVDDPERIARLEVLGADGVITNDPRLFGPRTG